MLFVIYVTGLGDTSPERQKRAINAWNKKEVKAELYQMNWADKKPWQEKHRNLLSRIDELSKEYKVGLVGASAGASEVINAFADRKNKLAGCVLIAGKINRPNTIGAKFAKHNSAFVTSINKCQESLSKLESKDKRRILSLYGIIDEMVFRGDSYLPDANNRRVLSFGHFLTIASQMTLFKGKSIRFLKNCADD